MKFEFNLKKILILLIALIIVFIPTYIAIGSYYRKSGKNPGAFSTSTRLEVTSPSRTYTATADNDPDGLWSAIESAIKNSTSVSSLPDQLSDADALLAAYVTDKTETDENGEEHTTSTTQQYMFYYSSDYSACYYKDPKANVFKIREKDAKEFINLNAASYLFKGAVLPVLSLSGEVIEPSDMKWNYPAAGNVYKTITKGFQERATVGTPSGTTPELRFTDEPTSCTLRVYDGTSVLYDGAYGNVPPLSFKNNTELRFVMTATWAKEQAAGTPYGEASYDFFCVVRAPAYFKLNTESIYLGEFAVLSAFNVEDPSKVSFSSSPTIPHVPVFYSAGSVCHALIPISYGCATGSYVFELGYEGNVSSVTLSVKDYRWGYKTNEYDISAAMIDALYTDRNVDALAALEKEINSAASGDAMFSGAFLDYQKAGVLTRDGSYIRSGFGRNISLVKDSSTPKRSYEHTGVDFEVDSGVSVPAMNAGRVCAVGNNELLGKYVVIDHGYGLRTWYAHLGETAVKVGDAVTSGQPVGTSGSTGFTVSKRVHVAASIGEIFIAPYSLWESGVYFAADN